MGYFRRILKERFLGVSTTLPSRASHPMAQSKMEPLPTTSFLSCASESSPVGIESVPNGTRHLAYVFLDGEAHP